MILPALGGERGARQSPHPRCDRSHPRREAGYRPRLIGIDQGPDSLKTPRAVRCKLEGRRQPAPVCVARQER